MRGSLSDDDGREQEAEHAVFPFVCELGPFCFCARSGVLDELEKQGLTSIVQAPRGPVTDCAGFCF
jgi:hypothetical protein